MFKKSFFAIMLVVIGIFAAGTAQADFVDGLVSITNTNNVVDNSIPAGSTAATSLHMYVNPGGKGDALIYGYYNARNAWDFLRVVNTSETLGVAAKVRFREGKNSNEVLDFAICLSRGDQWSAWIVGDGVTANPAQLVWYDSDTPTYPDPQGNDKATDNLYAAQSFKFAPNAASSVTADDTKEGYFEIIGARAWLDLGSSALIDTPEKCRTAAGIEGGTTLPACTYDGKTNTYSGLCIQDVPNVLFGNHYIFNVGNILAGTGMGTYAYNATALANFRDLPIAISLASDSSPRLDDSSPDVNSNGTGIDEVNYVLSKVTEYATYDIQSDWGGSTTIINTFPTKRLTINWGNPFGNLDQNGPFNDNAHVCKDGTIGTYDANEPSTGYCSKTDTSARCEYVGMKIWDDKENSPATTTGFSPGETATLAKCDEVTLIAIGETSDAHSKPLLDSNLVNFRLNTAGYNLGWVAENFRVDGSGNLRYTELTTNTGSHYAALGMPVISYEIQGIFGSYLTHMLPLRYDAEAYSFRLQ